MNKISIITATYNSQSTVEFTLRSIAEQTHPVVEHIIIDGFSSDKTLEIVKSYPHVHTIISERDSGIYEAMNKGIAIASGDIIGILNSDDIYVDRNVLEEVANIFNNEAIDACYADLQYVESHETSKVVRRWKSGNFSNKSFYWGWMPPHPTFFVRKKVYERVGMFNTDLKSAADYELMLRILVKNKMSAYYMPKTIVSMSTGGISNATLYNRIRANKEDRLAWKMNGLRPYFFTLYLKPLRKITQFLIK